MRAVEQFIQITADNRAGQGSRDLLHLFRPGHCAGSLHVSGGKGLTELVDDQFCILKVGPWLTFAYREACLRSR
ncbi:MAG: D-tagatose,6-bisphosphate aldolase subunit GatZ/KbaZ-like [Verrucomicrobiota bacterium]|jgi:tagatose-1,6-bisphosphate aldolase non-catalytic subunit AgaZ/GatZ|nr:D-tagatose,6-bisphosphate aldolase subunit GatZ/KbaZ-like [Verrucomicrobiota bacterium]MDK2964100.1 D-tagatose,6-bisphosphate aldolase subunit GatZ/KbaZ-like [Verrucomicrobiota bacterium]